MPTLTFTSSQSWTVPAYSTLTITVEGGTGANGSNGANFGTGDGGFVSGGSGGSGGVGGKSIKSLTSATGPTAGSSLSLNIGGITAISAGPGSRFTFGTNPTAYDGGTGGNGGDASQPDPESGFSGIGANGSPGADGTATGGDTNTAGGSSKSVATITIVYTAAPVSGVGSASGVAAASAQGRAIVARAGSAAGSAAVAAVGSTSAPTGRAAGVASVTGAGASTASAAGVSAGIANAVGRNVNTIAAVGVSAGVATAVGKNYRPSRIIMGKLPSGAYGLRISEPGYNASLDPIDDTRLFFSSEWPDVMPIHQIGSAIQNPTLITQSVVTQTVSFPSLGYVPFVEFYVQSRADALPAGGSTYPDSRWYHYGSMNLLYYQAPANAYLRLNATDGQLRFESYTRNVSGDTFGASRSYVIYWVIYRRRAF